MFKPRLRISRACAARLSAAAPRPSPPSPFAVPARQQQQHLQKRSLHASPARQLHSVAPLTDDDRFEREGVRGLMTAEAFEIAYNTYQAHVLNKLNEYTAGTAYADMTTLETAIATAREPHLAATFNYASMAHNNHFFFSGLSKTGGADRSEHMSEMMRKALELSFGSLETLQREMLLTADAMFGPGFVWLVQQMDATGARAWPFKILTTYQAGSPYPSAHWRSQGSDMNNHGSHGEGGQVVKEYFNRQNTANRREPLHGAAPAEKNRFARPPGGTDVVPVLCVNTWEHVWMWDYGVGGKMDFLTNWWNIIDWGRVESLSRLSGKRAMTENPQVGPGVAQVAQPAPAPADSAVEGAPQ
ncbi:hypothetical protein KVR01_005531 [Diaporthe batatas]|uniref:uncharacterized protein n=1 Tax=Diaporthe batatas TaxID=748121 RepID=UPI001D03A6A0|nr:uncharacterized protein KVR01_005531 [Diaporthe batatas]KAG8165256.1 hypothetical protein KVR01_005531 [Diaporthe batatas]